MNTNKESMKSTTNEFEISIGNHFVREATSYVVDNYFSGPKEFIFIEQLERTFKDEPSHAINKPQDIMIPPYGSAGIIDNVIMNGIIQADKFWGWKWCCSWTWGQSPSHLDLKLDHNLCQ
eukprot:8732638-Ditylum_brightwellii.AAC.1